MWCVRASCVERWAFSIPLQQLLFTGILFWNQEDHWCLRICTRADSNSKNVLLSYLFPCLYQEKHVCYKCEEGFSHKYLSSSLNSFSDATDKYQPPTSFTAILFADKRPASVSVSVQLIYLWICKCAVTWWATNLGLLSVHDEIKKSLW